MIRDLKARFSGYLLIVLFVHRFIQIKNTAALLTPEVVVVLGAAVEPADSAGKT